MRIRGSATHAPSPLSLSLSPCSSPSSSSSCFSLSTTSSHSLTSSSDSTSSSFSSPRRCHGLDLLVKAVYHVAGSVVGVPYIQRRVIRRRKPALRFSNFLIDFSKPNADNDEQKAQGKEFDCNLKLQKKKKRRSGVVRRNSIPKSSKQSDLRRRRLSTIEV